ncbi:MAG: hypothetical protein ACI4KM_12465 [Oscillospiraceae bacterium]
MGFIKLSDDLKNWAWYGDNNTLLVYIRLLVGAVWHETEFQNVILHRGQIATTLPRIASENGISVQQARTALDRLKSTGKITVKLTPKFRIITLNNYDCENVFNSPNNSPTTGYQHANNSPTLYKSNIQSTEEQNTCASGAVRIILDEAVREYNEICKSLEPLTGELTYQQGRLVVEAHKELHGVSFKDYFKRVEASAFLIGKSSSGFKADFNWLIRPDNVAKVLSGKYDVSYGSGAVSANTAEKDYNEPLWDD